jgi:DNA-binding NarL/FixJ family response regulator
VSGATSQRITVLVADANLMACRLLAGLLERQRDFEVVACTSDQESLLRSAKKTPVEVALIAAEWGDGRVTGLAMVQRMREANPDCAIVLLLDDTSPHLVVEAMRAGARGVFFRSEFESAALCKCVRRVYEGQIWLKSKDVKHLVDALAQPRCLQVLDAGGVNLLTNREQDVMRLVAEGLGNREIAQQLNLSQHTVKNYLFHIFDKLGVSNRVELVLYATTIAKKLESISPARADAVVAAAPGPRRNIA